MYGFGLTRIEEKKSVYDLDLNYNRGQKLFEFLI